MGNIYFNHKNRKYKIFFYPCGNFARVESMETKNVREIRYDKNTTVKSFVKILPKILDF